ncbi:acyl-homoserine-lactone synthase [Methylobacterium aerolatum]|uniref:Acyl-homoserine-lactone synthase n=1 Tax=Methylobacterium aerolatum TaxID=418708 RepID=A0ABU0I0L4_9HYPH|nr:acyl-homoserine-lactone synthase [Methylobacterium aerolatum]MDQ0448145.1 acyl-homoserine lactone synthase [Methylobacterium aerolatum]GJD33988.1 4-coumaroyl-homoserine lactone synthase [Methylobacterium aerolatum]
MIHVVNADQFRNYHDLLEEAWRLRHRIFVKEMGWSAIARDDGREIDEFDDDHAVHLLAVADGELVGYSRLLPTTRPYVLSSHLPELCEGPPPSAPHIVEWSRIGVSEKVRTSGRRLNPTALDLLTAIVEWGLPRGIRGFVSEMPTSWLLRLLQLHIHALPLGLPRTIDGVEIVAVNAGFDERSLRQLQAVRGSTESVLADHSRSTIKLAS